MKEIILRNKYSKQKILCSKTPSLIHKSYKNVDKKSAKNFRVRKNYFYYCVRNFFPVLTNPSI